MARAMETLVTQSLMDRLSSTEEWPTTRAQSLRMMRESLKRDMEWLLNTRQSPVDHIQRFARASRSVIHYGLIDTSSLSMSSTVENARLQQAVQDCITAFEPRLLNVRVTIENRNSTRQHLSFHIEAQIDLDPVPEEISFDTVLDLTRGEYTVS